MRKKFRLRKEIRKIVLKHKTFSPKAIRDIILREYNVERTPESITMFLKRNPQLVEELKSKIGEIDAQHENIRFDKDYWIDKDFKSQIPIIQQWIDTLLMRKVRQQGIRTLVNLLRKICMGVKGHDRNLIQIKDWKLHPLALTEEKAVEFIIELNRRGYHDHEHRLCVRSFLKFGKGEQPRKIGGEKTFGKYGHLHTSKENVLKILNWLLEENCEIGVYCMALYKTGTRALAMKNAKLSNLNEKEKTLVVFDKGRKGEKIKWIKHLDDQLLYELQPLIEKGKLFEDIDIDRARELCKEAYRKFIPKLAKDIPMPLHFWRHLFAQMMLRATDWNYTVVARLGGWKDKNTLESSYGLPPEAVVKKWGLKYVPMI